MAQITINLENAGWTAFTATSDYYHSTGRDASEKYAPIGSTNIPLSGKISENTFRGLSPYNETCIVPTWFREGVISTNYSLLSIDVEIDSWRLVSNPLEMISVYADDHDSICDVSQAAVNPSDLVIIKTQSSVYGLTGGRLVKFEEHGYSLMNTQSIGTDLSDAILAVSNHTEPDLDLALGGHIAYTYKDKDGDLKGAQTSPIESISVYNQGYRDQSELELTNMLDFLRLVNGLEVDTVPLEYYENEARLFETETSTYGLYNGRLVKFDDDRTTLLRTHSIGKNLHALLNLYLKRESPPETAFFPGESIAYTFFDQNDEICGGESSKIKTAWTYSPHYVSDKNKVLTQRLNFLRKASFF